MNKLFNRNRCGVFIAVSSQLASVWTPSCTQSPSLRDERRSVFITPGPQLLAELGPQRWNQRFPSPDVALQGSGDLGGAAAPRRHLPHRATQQIQSELQGW